MIGCTAKNCHCFEQISEMKKIDYFFMYKKRNIPYEY